MVICIKFLQRDFELNIGHEGELKGISSIFEELVNRGEAKFREHVSYESFKAIACGCIEFKPLVRHAYFFVRMESCYLFMEFAMGDQHVSRGNSCFMHASGKVTSFGDISWIYFSCLLEGF